MWKLDLIGLDENENVNGASFDFDIYCFTLLPEGCHLMIRVINGMRFSNWILNCQVREKFLGIDFYFMGEKFFSNFAWLLTLSANETALDIDVDATGECTSRNI